MLHKLRPLIVLLVIAGIAGGAYWYFTQNPDKLTEVKLRLGLITPAEATGVYIVSGYIESDEVTVAPEVKGRIMAILADEGDYVEAGQTVASFDTALLDAKIQMAEAKIETAKAKLAKVEAGVRAEDIAIAEAGVAVAQANAQAANTQLQDAITLRDNPQELDMQIDAARTTLELAGLQIAANVPIKDASETMWNLGKQQWEDVQENKKKCKTHPLTGEKFCITIEFKEGLKQDLGVGWNLAGADMWQAWVGVNSAVAQQADAETQLNDLLRLRNDPQVAQVRVAQADAAYQAALAEVDVAGAQLNILETGPRSEQISVAEAQVIQTEANLESLQLEREKSTLTAPMSGWVVKRVAHQGEMAQPGVSLLQVANLTDLTLTVYVSEPDVGLVSVGQDVKVFVDTFPGEPFIGQITYISNKAEFTPKNVQTKEERVNTVFAVKIKLKNSEQRLKPGMPADAIIAEVGEPASEVQR